MRHKIIALVACSATKRSSPSSAENLYSSALFSNARNVAKTVADSWFILSAKHGLLAPSTRIEPYDTSLKDLTRPAKDAWVTQVESDITSRLPCNSTILLLAGRTYSEDLGGRLRARGFKIVEPLAGFGIGTRIAWLKGIAADSARVQRYRRFQELLERLKNETGQGLKLSELTAKQVWPSRGVYFFVDDTERMRLWPDQVRVVRVGTHGVSAGSRSSLWNRLKTHRGLTDGGGSHRSSVFRRHVGMAMLRRASAQLESWGQGSVGQRHQLDVEKHLEKEVSAYIGNLRLYFVAIEDVPGAHSDRAYIEQNAIALLSGIKGPIDVSSRVWLGRWADRDLIKSSGLWNVNHVHSPEMNADWLDVLESHIDATLAQRPITESIAPANWKRDVSATRTTLDLFAATEKSVCNEGD